MITLYNHVDYEIHDEVSRNDKVHNSFIIIYYQFSNFSFSKSSLELFQQFNGRKRAEKEVAKTFKFLSKIFLNLILTIH